MPRIPQGGLPDELQDLLAEPTIADIEQITRGLQEPEPVGVEPAEPEPTPEPKPKPKSATLTGCRACALFCWDDPTDPEDWCCTSTHDEIQTWIDAETGATGGYMPDGSYAAIPVGDDCPGRTSD